MAALTRGLARNAPAATRAVAIGEYAAGAGRAQRVLPKPTAVSSAYHAVTRCRPCGHDPAAGFLLVISGHRVCALRLFICTRSHTLHATTALDAWRKIKGHFHGIFSATSARDFNSALQAFFSGRDHTRRYNLNATLPEYRRDDRMRYTG